jgi:hypothetical protein
MALFLREGQPEFYQRFVTVPRIDAEDSRLLNATALKAELLSFLDLYSGQSVEQDLDEIILFGKYASAPNIGDVMNAAVGLPCRYAFNDSPIPSALKKLEIDQLYRQFDVISAGMVDNAVQPLIPDEVRRSRDRRTLLSHIGTMGILTLLMIGNLHLQALVQQENSNEILKGKQAISSMYEKSAGYKAYLSLIGKLNRDRARIRSESRPSHIHLILKELSLTIPDEITLNGIYVSTENQSYILRLEGNVRLSGFSPEIILAQYVESLNKSPLFEKVSVTGYSKTQENDRFDLSFHLQMGARV